MLALKKAFSRHTLRNVVSETPDVKAMECTMLDDLLKIVLRAAFEVATEEVVKSASAHAKVGPHNYPDADDFFDEAVRSVESNGFWLLTSLLSSGACLQYDYWIEDWKHTGILLVNDEPKRFVETELNPTKIRVRVLGPDE